MGLEQLPKLLENSHISPTGGPKCGHVQNLLNSLAQHWQNLPDELKQAIHQLPDELIELLHIWELQSDSGG